jgi:hypothetical protein
MYRPGTYVEKLSKTTKAIVYQVLKQGFESENPRVQCRNLDPPENYVQFIIAELAAAQSQRNSSCINLTQGVPQRVFQI